MQLVQVWRYPVKSMLGESLAEATIGPLGIGGDRQWAVVDAESGVSLSAKRHGDLLRCRAWSSGEGVMITLPDGAEYRVDSPEAASALSSFLNRRVAVQAAGRGRTVRHEFPTDLAHGGDEVFIHEPGFEAFFDRAPLHLLTTSTLKALSRIQPASTFSPARFRPNLLVETTEDGFLEDRWVGNTVAIGTVKCEVLDRKPRCIMTTRPQGDLAKDPAVLRTVARENEGNAGVELRAHAIGTVRASDMVTVSL